MYSDHIIVKRVVKADLSIINDLRALYSLACHWVACKTDVLGIF